MDLDKAVDILRGPRTEDDGGDPQIRRQKIETARAVVEYFVSAEARRSVLDYTSRAGALFEGLCYMHGDSDTSVWMAADEGIVKLLKLLTPEYTDLFCGLLILVMSSPPGVSFVPPARTLKLAIKHFSEVCHMLDAGRVRGYVGPVVAALSAFAATRDEGLIEIVSQCVGPVYRTVAWAMDEEQAAALDRAFLPLLTDPSAQTRRFTAIILTALAEHYPHPRYCRLVDELPCWKAAKSAVAIETSGTAVDTAGTPVDEKYLAAARHGALLCVLGLVRIRSREATFLDDGGDPVEGILDRVVPLCTECLGVEDNTLIGAAAEALSQTLSDHGSCGYMWAPGTRSTMWAAATQALLRVVYASKAARVGTRSVAVACLAQLYRYRPAETFAALRAQEEALHQQQQRKDEESGSTSITDATSSNNKNNNGGNALVLDALLKEGDPTFLGNVAVLLAEAVVAHVVLRGGSEASREAAFRALFGAEGVTGVLDTITGFFRAHSYMTARMGCAALSRCVGALMRSARPEYRRRALAAVAAFLGTGADAYWVVKLEVAGALAAVDYRALGALEGALEESHLCGNIQRQALDYILGLLDSNDPRVRHGAAVALAQLAEHLWLPGQIEANPSLQQQQQQQQQQQHSSSAWDAAWPGLPARSSARGVQLVMSLLIQRTLILHPQTRLKGVYHALQVVAARFGTLYHPSVPGNGEFSTAPNPLCSYAADLMPLVIERLAAGSPFALDLDSHVDALRLVGCLAREGADYMARFSARVFVHCLKLLNTICFVSTTRAPPPCPLKDLTPNHSYFVQNRISNNFAGNFYTSQGYVDMYARLYNTFTTSLTTISPAAAAGSEHQSADKFSDLRSAALYALAMTIRCIGPDVASKTDEILAYMQILYIQDKDYVIHCTGELFKALFMHSLPLEPLPPAMRGEAKGERGKSGGSAREKEDSSIFVGWCFEKYEIGPLKVKKMSDQNGYEKFRDSFIKFEPLVMGMLETYQTSNDGHTRALVLQFITLLIKGGVNKISLFTLSRTHTFINCLFFFFYILLFVCIR